MWVQDEFAAEPWFNFVGYQSGHSSSDESHRWNVEMPAKNWPKQPTFPLLNLEPNYEAHSAGSGKVFTAYEVRRAAYWSLLAAPIAGVSYGGHGIWSWELRPTAPMTHPYTGTAQPWYVAMNLPGATSMKHLKSLFSSLAWHKLRPAPELLVTQPGTATPAKFVIAAQSDEAVVIYVPADDALEINTARLKQPMNAEWFNPATGVHIFIGKVENGSTRKFKANGARDWVLVLRSQVK